MSTLGAQGTHKLIEATGTGAGTSFVAKWVKDKTFQVSGTFVGTIKIQVSNDNANWIDLVETTGTGGFENSAPWHYVRANCTAYTSGTIVVTIGT